ncbi:MAG: histidine--tRNA ligase [Corallococcus sp.]|nr:histidine--tRNA ligase [Corallococcus sp.]MCM1359239.1 histidine--tRNA ligase [Corallococcus sp.]MCM1394630.1 histidine--tRNA ligase [Corallococcus sp.]
MLPKTPAKGMRDFLPKEFALRQKILSTIQSTYESYGFSRIETPSVENLSLLTSKQGGDNEKLIFKILKRGEKLENSDDGQLCDLGLRYDLTVPLARFYANNMGQLPSVFKAIQMDNVWRADRPQRGRFRQFVQCDIDIIGEETNIAEIELILATTSALSKLGFDNLNVRISDRRLLTALADKCGFLEEQKSAAFIALDKLDKIGITGVMQEIEEIAPGKAEQFVNLIGNITGAVNPFERCVSELGEYLPAEVKNNLEEILYVTNECMENGKVSFDVTLVRGMGYYTGTIYEISVDGLASSIAGGGRYDKMIGKICGCDVPACGFSVGFERIALLLAERGEKFDASRGIAVIVPKDADKQQLLDAEEACLHLREKNKVTVLRKIKNFAYQLKQLNEDGYDTVYEYKLGKLNKLD